MRLTLPALMLLAVACTTGVDRPGDTNDPLTCTPACTSWQQCNEGVCATAAGHCAASSECTKAGEICDSATHTCMDDPRCDACETWQECSAGACVSATGRCARDAECSGAVCDLKTHQCVAAACDPACSEWQTCTGHTCGLTAGRCLADTDCPAAKPVCDTTAHTCGEPVFAAPLPAATRALIVTSDALLRPFQDLAHLHTMTGVTTRVVTMTEVCTGKPCNADPRTDKAKALKDYLAAQPGLELVVLGGDIEHVPSRQVHDHFENAIAGANFTQDFYTDYYFGDLSNWDSNNDGVYAADVDSTDYTPELGVTRIPASTVAEADRYVQKVVLHLTAYDLARVRTALLLSNVATKFTIMGFDIPIDGALYFAMDGRTESLVKPFTLTKLYAVPPAGVEQITLNREIEELQRSHAIVVHNGHGWVHGLTSEIDGTKELTGDMAYGLENTQYPFILSCACDAGTFSANDSAGEDVVNAPDGGAIGYLGNSATGLGLAGGSQFVDEFLRHSFAHPNALVGEAMKAAHKNLPQQDEIPVPVPFLGNVGAPVVDQDSYMWTQKSAVFLGDGLIPVWTEPTLSAAPTVTVTRTPLGAFARLSFTISRAVAGTLRVAIGADVFEVPVSGTTGAIVVRASPARVSWGFSSATTLAAQGEAAF